MDMAQWNDQMEQNIKDPEVMDILMDLVNFLTLMVIHLVENEKTCTLQQEFNTQVHQKILKKFQKILKMDIVNFYIV